MLLIRNPSYDPFQSLKIVTLDYVYGSLESLFARDVFWSLLRLRGEGYGPDYQTLTHLLDSIDYICRHHLICIEKNGLLDPIGGFRQVILQTCDYFHS